MMIEAIAKRSSQKNRNGSDLACSAGSGRLHRKYPPAGRGRGPGRRLDGCRTRPPGQTALAELLGLPRNVEPYSVVGIGYPAEDADLEAVDRFDASRIHYNKY